MRIAGFDRVPVTPLVRNSSLPPVALTSVQRRRATARRLLAARGLVEAVTYSFMSSEQMALFGAVPVSLRLANPISSELDVMRTTILPNLLSAAGRNADRGIPNGALFEVGPQYAGTSPDDQAMVAAGIRSGRTQPRHWADAGRPVDVFDAKNDAFAVLAAIKAPSDKLMISDGAPDWYHPGRSGTLRLGPANVFACFGEIHPRILRRLGIDGPVAAFEVFLDKLPSSKQKDGALRPPLDLPTLQPVERDFAFVVDAPVPAQDVVRAARSADKTLIVDVRVFDLFVGESVGAGKKSIAITVVLQPTERTLTDADLDVLADSVRARVEKATGGVLRS